MSVAQLIKRLSPVLEDDGSNPTDDLCLYIFTLIVTVSVAKLIRRLSPVLKDDGSNMYLDIFLTLSVTVSMS